MKKEFLLITLLLLAANVQAEEYYRSIDENGKVHYGDAPAQNAADIEKLNSRSAPNADDALPFDTRRAHAKFPVTLYVADSCGNGCTRAREYLTKRGIPFAEKNLVTAEDIAAFKKVSGGDQVPVMNIGTDWITGFLQSQWSQALDAAGYPKNAPYGSRPPVKSTPAPDTKKSE